MFLYDPTALAVLLMVLMGTHRATILSNAVCESTVAFCSDFNLIGTLQQDGLLQITSFFVHVGNAVLTVVCDVLCCLGRH